jgi:hypothetical protein
MASAIKASKSLLIMRDDLLEAKASVNWADAHIPVLQNRFVSWQQAAPYYLIMEPDPQSREWEFLVAYLQTPLDLLILGDIGAIINSARTALDLLMAAILARHSVKPRREGHFPIRKTAQDFLSAINMLEEKKWISAIEAAAIKRLKAYSGGHPTLYAIHQLDILRKHERLLTVEPAVDATRITQLNGISYVHRKVREDKTILYRIPTGTFRPTKGNTLVSAEIFLDEPALGINRKPAILTLQTFVAGVRGIVDSFP